MGAGDSGAASRVTRVRGSGRRGRGIREVRAKICYCGEIVLLTDLFEPFRVAAEHDRLVRHEGVRQRAVPMLLARDLSWLTIRSSRRAHRPELRFLSVLRADLRTKPTINWPCAPYMRAVRTAKIGVDSQYCRRARRHFARPCLDWSERRPHLAGALGAGIASALLDRQWLRRARTARGIEVTSQGSAACAVPSASISNSAPWT
jgi:hypothetical protein